MKKPKKGGARRIASKLKDLREQEKSLVDLYLILTGLSKQKTGIVVKNAARNKKGIPGSGVEVELNQRATATLFFKLAQARVLLNGGRK